MGEEERARLGVLVGRLEGQMREVEGRAGGGGGNAGGHGGHGGGAAQTVDHSQEALQATTETVMEAQDDMLTELAGGVSRLASQARMINSESNLHVSLLNDMEGDVEGATEGLREEARRAERVREESGVCRLYIIIVALTALLVFLIVMGFSR